MRAMHHGCVRWRSEAREEGRGVVLDVAKLTAGREDYYLSRLADNREEYLSGHGESPGRWYGHGARSLGLDGEATKEGFRRLIQGRDPKTAELLGREHGRHAVTGFDLVLRPAKSVSVLYGLGDAATGRAVLEAHHVGLAAATAYLDGQLGARRGHGGAEHVVGDGLLAVGFDHRTSRAGDPLVHTHLVVANRVQGPDGRWTALDGRDVYRHRRAADAVYRAALQRELTRSLGVAWTDADRHGNREVRGMPGELVRAFSKRTEQVNAEVERLESSGRLRTPRLVKWAVHATRKAKEHEAPETLYARWRAEAAERGTDPDALVRGVTGRVAARERDQAPSEALAAHPTLREDQAGMVRDACLDGAGVQVVVGRPGTGKTYTLGVARHAWQLGGYRVLAAAPTGIATVSLEAEGFEEVATVDRLQLELDRGGERLDARSVLVVDEAGMVGSRKLTRLLEHAQRARAKVVLVGDDRQLAAIDAGGGFRALRLRLGASELTENRRQLHAWQREAIELVRQGEVDQAVELYRAHERVVAAGSKQELALALLNDWWRAWKEAEQDPTKDVVVLAARRDEVDRLNTYCQQVLAKHERLGTERLRVEDREVAIGDRVVCGRNALRQLGIANGSRGQVVGLDARARTLTVRLDGSEREVALPRWYLDGRAGAERNRRVDLAYATTGHRAQGLTKWRALVRVTGGEDVNWFTVQLSRARQDTRLYAVVGPEPHEAAGELDLPDVERGDAFTQFNRALGKDRSQRLALDTASTPDVRRLSTAELRRERDRLTGQLAEAPRDRSRELARARDRRVQAEAELAARREQHGTMLRRPGRGGERAGVQAGAEAVAAQQADRATRRERELRGHQQRRAGWLEQHAPLVGGYQQAVLALAWQRRARGLACEAIEQDRPGYLRDALGPVPESTRGKRAWRQAAAHIEEYRGVYPVTDPERALGPAPREAAQRADWQRATAAIERVHHKQRVAERDHQPTRMHSTRQQQSRRATAPSGTRPAGRVPSGPPASTTEGGPMARSHPHPDNERERFPLPWEDDDTPGVSVHALTRADVEAILAQMPDEPDTDPPLRLPSLRRAAAARQDRRALGTPGASAQAEYRRRRQVEYAAWARTLPLRMAATVLAGVGGGLVATVAGLPMPAGLLAAMVTAGAAWWRLRFRPSPETQAWQRGAAGERHVAQLLEPLVRQGWGVSHDLHVPGSKANIDHVVIGPPGVFVIDTKNYRGRLRLSHDGLLWHGRTFLAPTLSATRWEADKLQARIGAPDIAVVPIVAVLGAMVPFGQVTSMDVTVIPARRLAGLLRGLPPTLTPQRAREVAAQINRRLDTYA